MEVATKLCSQKLRLRLTLFVLLTIVILIICRAQFSAEPPVHQTEQGELLTDYEFKR